MTENSEYYISEDSDSEIKIIEAGLDDMASSTFNLGEIKIEEDLMRVRAALLGKEGLMSEILHHMKGVTPYRKKELGLRINEIVTSVKLAFEERLFDILQKKEEQEADVVMVYVRNLNHDFGVFKIMKEDGLLNDLVQKLSKEKIFNLYKRYDVMMYEEDGRLHILLDNHKFHEMPSDNGAWIKPTIGA